jgi:hypothetical protein
MSNLQDAIRLTEAEILGEAMGDHDFDEGNPAYQNMPEGDGADDWLEQTEGFDGEPLSDVEQFAATTGDVPEGYLGDRPLQFMNEQALMAEVERLQAVNDLHVGNLNLLVAQPQAEAERVRLQNELLDVALDTEPGGRADQLLNSIRGQTQHVAEMQGNRVEAAMGAAHERYGDSFVDAYQAITAMSPNDPLAAQIVQRVLNSEDPGEAVMRFGSSDMVESLRARQPPPFMAGGRVAVPRGRGGLDNLDDLESALQHASGRAMGSDADIFESAMSDSRDNPYWENY